MDPDEQILLNEAIAWLEVYDDPDPGIYETPPPKEVMMRAEYARRARGWEAMVGERDSGENGSRIAEGAEPISNDTGAGAGARSSDQLQMPAEDRRNSALNLLFLLAQAYYKILECVVSSASWFCALDLE